jgi:hypothetical protein
MRRWLLSLVASAPAYAVVGGHTPSPQERALTAPVVQLKFGSGKACTATHLGEGWLLTARHCDDFGKVEVLTQCGNQVAAPAYYTWRYPSVRYVSKMRDQRGKTVEVPQPDIALLRVTDAEGLPNARAAYAYPYDGHDAWVAGYGFDTHGTEGAYGFAIGRVHLEASSRTHRRTTGAGGFASVGFGDSGGPIYSVYGDRMLVTATVSSFQEDDAEHVSLDGNDVYDWISPYARLSARRVKSFGEIPELPFAIPGLEDPTYTARRETVERQLRCLAELAGK